FLMFQSSSHMCSPSIISLYVLPPFLNISLFRDSNMDYIRSKTSESAL
uniref:Uncharacterized protein n=1 Tax=Aegilops tauschii subsp. strangulata TaxID=200361 RepID=A0A453Q347_AEGTS